MRKNPCILRKEYQGKRLPAKFYGYLSLCKDLKNKKSEIDEKAIVVLGNLPLVSKMTEKSSPEGVMHAYWSFLKY